MDLSFTNEEIAFRDEVRGFLAEHLSQDLREGAAASPQVFVEPNIGLKWQAILQRKGWLGYHLPVEFGGTSWTAVQRYIFEKECALAGAPHYATMGLRLLAPVICRFGTDEQKHHVVPRILSGMDYWCQGFSEPQSGSDLASLQTKAVRTDAHYVLTGSKLWTTHAQFANRMFCLARTDPSAKRQAGLSFFLVDMHQPGVDVRPILTLAGDHEVNAVFLDEVVVPLKDRVGEEGQGWAVAKFLLENERGGSCHAPRLLADLDEIDRLASCEPDGYGGVLSQQPDWRRRVAKSRLSARALELIELRILTNLAQGRQPGPQTSLTKLLASTLRQEIDLMTLDLFSAAGLQLDIRGPSREHGAEEALTSNVARMAASRYLNNRAWTIFGGTSEVQTNIIAKTVLNL
jgi:alkylation response protein AidB-like acyl-CoA dehydrogenase